MDEGGSLDLPKAIDESAFVEAVEMSGYPLQIVVGSALLERGYSLEEKWAFGDSHSGERWAIDVAAPREHQSRPLSQKGYPVSRSYSEG